MCNNAKRYNQKGSQVYLDAAQIARVVKNWSGDPENYSVDSGGEDLTKVDEALDGTDEYNNTGTYDGETKGLKNHISGIISGMKELKDRTGRRITDIFLEIPDKKMYPDYFKLIPKPIAIATIERRTSKTPYKTLEKFDEDLQQMYKNAFTFNEGGSVVANDAKALQKFTNRRIEEVAQEMARSFKIKLNMRGAQQTSQPHGRSLETPSHPATRIRLNIGGVGRATPVNVTPPSVTPDLRSKSPSLGNDNLKSEVATTVDPSQIVPQLVSPSSTPLVPKPAVPPTDQTWSYQSSGQSLLPLLTLATSPSQTAPPLILHVPSIPNIHTQTYALTLTMAQNTLMVTPTLSSHVEARPHSVSLTINGRRVIGARGGISGKTIYDVRMSPGMNCVECVVTAQTSNEDGLMTVGDGKERERVVVLVHLR